MVAGKVAAEHGDLEQVGSEGPAQDTRFGACRVDAVDCRDFGAGEDFLRRGLGPCPCVHGEEEDPPAGHLRKLAKRAAF